MAGNQLDVRGEVFLGSWTDFTYPYLYQRNPVNISRGRQGQSPQMTPSSATFTVNNRDNRWTIRNPLSPWYRAAGLSTGLGQNSPVRFSVPSSLAGIAAYLRLETDTASYASTPDAAALQITTGTLSVRIDCKPTDWISSHILIAKWGTTTATQAWSLQTNSDGTLLFAHSDSSFVGFSDRSTLPLPYFGARIAIRVDYNITAKTVTFFTAPTMSGSWTQLGAVINTGAASQEAGTGQIVQVGQSTGSIWPGMFGEVYEAQIIGASTVADPVFTSQTPGATSFTDAQSNTWTLTGTAELSGRLFRYHGELSVLPKSADAAQTDVYSDATALGIFNRLQQSQTPADSAMKRAYLRLPASLQLAGYWPGEDAAGSTQIGAAIGKLPMSSAGLTMAASTVFACSAPLPVMNGASAMALVDPSSVTWTDNAIRFLLAVPPGDDTTGSVLCQFTTQGTVAVVRVIYSTGGTINISGYNSAGTQLFNQSSAFGLAKLANCRMSVQLTNAGGGNITWAVYTVQPGSSLGFFFSGTIAGTIGGVTSVSFGGGLTFSAMGHFSVQGVADNPVGLNQPLYAWFGETAGARFSRLCSEEGINCRITGPPDKSVPMGFQTQQTIAQLLQEIENTDQGLMTEPRQILGLGYITNWALCNQPAVVTADMSQPQVMPTLQPTSDTQIAVNDVTMTAADGSIGRSVLGSGNMSVLTPPSGVGRLEASVAVNPAFDSQLPSLAGWYNHVRSFDEDRFPAIPFNMARAGTPQAVAVADIGHRADLINAKAWVPVGPVRQIVAGIQEALGPVPQWPLSFNGFSERPYEVCVLDDPVYGRLDTAGSALAQGVTSGATTLQVATTSGPAWTTAVGDVPFDIAVGGEQVTVTAVGAVSQPVLFSDDFEVSVANWTPFNCTLVQSSAQHHTGSFSGLMTAGTSPSVMTANSNVGVPVVPGAVYQAAGWMLAPVTLTSCFMQLIWFNAAGVNIATTLGTPGSATSAWGFFSTPQTVAPAGAASVLMGFGSNSPGTGAQLFIDGAGINVTAQAFTCTRSVNGISKAHVTAETVQLFYGPFLGI